MGPLRTNSGLVLLVLLAACGNHESDNVTVVTVSGSESSGRTGGGAIISVSALRAATTGWVFAPPKPFAGRIPPTSLLAVGDALFHATADAEVVDAIRTVRGTVALVRGEEGKLLLCLFGEDSPTCAPAPPGALRVIPGFEAGPEAPFSVRLVVADGLVVAATLAGD